jgi:hypothetical protein
VHLARPSSSLDNRTKLNTQPTDYVPRDALCIVNVIAEIAAKAGKIKFRARRLKIKNSHSRARLPARSPQPIQFSFTLHAAGPIVFLSCCFMHFNYILFAQHN